MRGLVGAGAGLIAVTYGLARFALGLFVPELQEALGLSPTMVGWVLAASFAGYLVALLAVGQLVGRFGARAVAVGAGLAAAAGTAGVAAAGGPVWLALAAFVGGASTGLASPALAAAVEARVPAAHRAASQTAINAGTSLGLIAAVPVALAVAATWRAAWATFAMVALASTAAVAAVMRGTRAGGLPADTVPTMPAAKSTAGGCRRPGVALAASAALLGLASATFWTFGREALESLGGLSPLVGRTAWLAVGGGGLLGAGAGTLARHVGLRAALVVAWVPLAGALAWVAAGPATPLPAYVAAASFGGGYMALTGLLIVWSVRARPDRPAAAVATAFGILAVGQAAGAPSAGVLVERAGLDVAFTAAALVAVAGAAARPGRHGPPGSERTRFGSDAGEPLGAP